METGGQRDAEICMLRATGFSYRQIAEAVGVSISTAYGVCNPQKRERRICPDCGTKMCWMIRDLPEGVDPWYCRECGRKPCAKCGQVRPITEYVINDKRGYRRSICKRCDAAESGRYYIENREEILSQARIRYVTDPGFAAAVCRRSKDWAAANAARVAARERARYLANAAEVKAAAVAWRRANPDQAYANARRWRDALRKGYVEEVDPLVLLELDDGVCGICGEDVDPFSFEIDHVWPVSRGGVHAYSNTRVTHRACNNAKRARVEE